MEIFERASKQKLRFNTNKGQLSTEDLWDLNLTSLNNLAKEVNKSLKEEDAEDFVEVKSTKSTELQLKLDILKRVIEVKLAEKEAAKTRLEKAERKAQIEELIGRKKIQDLESKSIEELKKELEEMG